MVDWDSIMNMKDLRKAIVEEEGIELTDEEIEDKVYELMDRDEMNMCDKCGLIDSTYELIWIDSEDFNPLEADRFNEQKYEQALEQGYSALCNECYLEECCDKED